MAPVPLLTLISDLGTSDPALAQVKGWVLSHYPGLSMVDISHHLPVADGALAGFRWQRAWPWFPDGSLHCCLCDRGVSDSLWLARCRQHWLAAMDEDCLRAAIPRGNQAQLWRRPWSNEGSATFRARDSLLPRSLATVSGEQDPAAEGWQRFPQWPQPAPSPTQARIADCDSFGNLILDYPTTISVAAIHHAGQHIPALRGTYASATGLVLIAGCDGFWEISLCGGRASEHCNLQRGDEVQVLLAH